MAMSCARGPPPSPSVCALASAPRPRVYSAPPRRLRGHAVRGARPPVAARLRSSPAAVRAVTAV
jgi:hypothetical protein